MPNITEFEAGDLAIRPSETGVEAHAMAGRRIGVSYNETAAAYSKVGAELGRGIANTGETAVNYMDHQQINAGADQYSKMFASLQDNLNKTLSDPNFDVHDPTSMQRWRQNVLEETLDQFSNSGFFTTEKSQQWANQRANELRQHFYVESEGAASHISGVAAEARINNSVRNYSNGVVANPSPGAVDFAVKSYKDHLEDTIAQFPNLKGEEAAKLREDVSEKGAQQIVHDGVMAAIMKGGDWRGIANKYPDYVNGAEMLQFEKAQRVQDRMNTAYEKSIQESNIRIANENVKASANGIWDKYVKVNADGSYAIDPQYFKEIAKIPGSNSAAPDAIPTVRSLLEIGEKIQKNENVATNGQVYSDLAAGIFTGQTTELTIQQAMANGSVNYKAGPASGPALLGLLKAYQGQDKQLTESPQFKYAAQFAQQTIEGVSASDKEENAGKFPAFMQDFLSQYDRARSSPSGVPANALDLNDPKSLIRTVMRQYRPSIDQMVIKNGGGPPPVPSYTPSAPAAPAKPQTVTQNGFTYTLGPDGKYH